LWAIDYSAESEPIDVAVGERPREVVAVGTRLWSSVEALSWGGRCQYYMRFGIGSRTVTTGSEVRPLVKWEYYDVCKEETERIRGWKYSFREFWPWRRM
jgi:hypothetical protein